MKIALIAVGAIVTLVAIGLVAAVITINSTDWSEYEEPIAQAVFDATGRRFGLDGHLAVRVGFTPTVAVSGVRFANAEWGTRPDMATLESLAIGLRLLPLVFGQVEISRVELIGLDVLLETDADGVGNWVFAEAEPPAAAEGEPADPASEGEGADAGEEGAPGYSTFLRRAVIENATLVYRDGVTGEIQEVAIDRFTARTRSESAPLEIELEARYGEETVALEGSLEGVPQLLAGGPLGLRLDAEAGGATVAVEGRIDKPLDATGLDLTLSVAGESLSTLSGLARSELPALGPYRLGAKVSGGGEEFRIRDLDAAMGGTSIKGEVTAQLGGERPRIEATLRSPKVDLADLQEPGAAGKAAPSGGSGGGGGSGGDGRLFPRDPLPLDGLLAADASIDLEIEDLRADTLRVSGLALTAKLDAGKLVLDPFTLGLAGGRVGGAVSLDASKSRPALAMDVDVRRLDLGQLARTQGSEILTGGTLDVDMDVRGSGGSVRAIMASLRGKLGIEMGEGTIQDRWAEILMSNVTRVVSNRGETGKAKVKCIVGDFDIAKGIARPSGLVVDTKSLSLFGSGVIDLREETLGLRFDRQARGVSVTGALPPFKVGGTLASPEPGLDAGALANKVVDLGAGLFGGGARQASLSASLEPSERCRKLLAGYEQALASRKSTKEAAAKTMGKITDESKSALDSVKGWFSR